MSRDVGGYYFTVHFEKKVWVDAIDFVPKIVKIGIIILALVLSGATNYYQRSWRWAILGHS